MARRGREEASRKPFSSSKGKLAFVTVQSGADGGENRETHTTNTVTFGGVMSFRKEGLMLDKYAASQGCTSPPPAAVSKWKLRQCHRM